MSVPLTVTRECPLCESVKASSEFSLGAFGIYAKSGQRIPVCDECATTPTIIEPPVRSVQHAMSD